MLLRIIKSLYHSSVYIIGIIVLIAAVAVTLIRIALPDVGIYHKEVETWLSRYMGQPVVFRSINANWKGWVPELELQDIDILDKPGIQPITHFDRAQISIAPFATLINWQITPNNLMISGFKLSVTHLNDGSLAIENFNLEHGKDTGTNKNELAKWLFKQNEIKIQEAQIEWLDLKNQQAPIQLSDVKIVLRNDIGRTQIEGSALLPPEYGNKLNFALDAFGNLLTSDWSGELYLAATGTNPNSWYKNYRPINFNVTGGIANIKIWSTWQQAQLNAIEGELQYDDFRILSKGNSLKTKKLNYRILGQRNRNDGWQFLVKLNDFVTDNGAWPTTDLSIETKVTETGSLHYVANFSYLKLDDVLPLIKDIPFVSDKFRKILTNKTSITGELYNGKLIIDPDKEIQQRILYDTKFDRLTIDLANGLPSFADLTGQIKGTLTQGTLAIDNQSAKISLPRIDITKKLSGIKGDINWKQLDTNWQFKTDLLQIKTPDFSAKLAGFVSKNEEITSPFLDLIVDLEKGDLEKISDYLPVTPRFKLRHWMQRNLSGGKIESANAVVRGYLADFPFDNNNGRFKLIANITGATIDYSPSWPPVDQINGETIFDGRNMLINIQQGKIFNAEISTATASMDDYLQKEKLLGLNGQVNGNIKDLTLFINQSPLKKDLALNELSHVMNSGDFNLNVNLEVPIKQGDKLIEIDGKMRFTDLYLKSSIKNLVLDELHGTVSFTRESISSESLKANYFGNPVDVTVSGTRSGGDNLPAITISGITDREFIIDRLIDYAPAAALVKEYLLEQIHGKTSWQTKLIYNYDVEQSYLNKIIEIESDLNGLEFDLPAPVRKIKESTTPIKITTQISQDSVQTVNIQYDPEVSLSLHLDKRDTTQNDKLLINGTVNTLSVPAWSNALKLATAKIIRDKSGTLINSIGVDLQLSSLELFGQSYSNVNVKANKKITDWYIQFDSEDIKGNVVIPETLDKNSHVQLDLDKLHIKQKMNAREANGARINPLKIPSLTAEIDDFTYLEHNLGKLQLESIAIDDGVSIKQFEFIKPSLHIKGTGKWVVKEDQDGSRFMIDLKADHMDAMLETFGYRVKSINKGGTNFQINANWSGSPMDFSLERLNGTLTMQISKGRFLDINPAAGRLFGLLSIQTLPRRLSLDFSDLFGKGLAFDKIEGSFEITNGNAYTNNLYLRGPAADIDITGRTGLSEQDYDQIVTVTPQVSDNLPVASALFGPVGIGVGALLYLGGKMFKSVNDNIDKLLRYQYIITGSWNDPIVEKIKDKEKSG